jgi:hypothetical protein
MNTFTEQGHEYKINGRVVPSVTQVLADLIPGWMASEWYLQRGTAVHACAAMIARGIPFTHVPEISGQVQAIRRFFREVRPQVIDVELRLYSETYNYAGTCDLIAVLPGNQRRVVLDWKASISKATPYQLAAYGLIYDLDYGAAVEIRDDGTYGMSEGWNLRRYKQEWLALLTAYNVRRRCGIKREGAEG